MTKLLITADDYGMCPEVDTAIEGCVAAGSVRCVAVMANMPGLPGVAALRARYPDVSLGLHWTLTMGSPVLPPQRVRSLVDADGRFWPLRELRLRWMTGRISPKHVRAELIAQHDALSACAGQPAFWNTHEHAYLWPGLFRLFVGVARTIGIPAVRCHKRIRAVAPGTGTPAESIDALVWLKRLQLEVWCRLVERQGFASPDGILCGVGFSRGNADIERMLPHVPWSRGASCLEVIIHPATAVQPALFGSIQDQRVEEYTVYRDPELRTRLRQAGAEVISFHDLKRPNPRVRAWRPWVRERRHAERA